MSNTVSVPQSNSPDIEIVNKPTLNRIGFKNLPKVCKPNEVDTINLIKSELMVKFKNMINYVLDRCKEKKKLIFYVFNNHDHEYYLNL